MQMNALGYEKNETHLGSIDK